ncbi:MAG: methyltransferase [Saccharofermentans sp.]|nr:methyltransferase [Saccharofermentans sp.]
MAHYFDAEPITESVKKTVDYRVNGMNFSFVTDTNTFSRSGVDKGTDLMITTVIDDIKARGAHKGERLLDLGCGWGVVGITMKKVFMTFDVTQTDVNSRAVKLSKENAELNRVKIDFQVAGDVCEGIPADKKFDIVMTNPPVRAGKKTVFAFYDQAYEHMDQGATIYVVLQRKQGAPSSEKKLTELFGNCETIAISGGYHIMKSVKE